MTTTRIEVERTVTTTIADGMSRLTHIERLNLWNEFTNPAHIPGIGAGFVDAAVRRRAEELKNADDGRKPGKPSFGRNWQPNSNLKPD
jgi:hypothetical protein